MNDYNHYKYVGMAGIISAILFIISIVGMQFYLLIPLEDTLAFTQNMNNSHLMMLLYGWPGLIATILIIPLIYVFYKENIRNKFGSRMLFIIINIGLSFVMVGYLFHLALTYFFAPIHHQVGTSDQEMFGYIIKATIGLQDMFWLAGDLFSFIGIALLLILTIREEHYSKWFLIFGATAGFLAAIGSLGFIPAFKQTPGLSFLFIGGFSLFVIWEIIAGIQLIKKFKYSTSTF